MSRISADAGFHLALQARDNPAVLERATPKEREEIVFSTIRLKETWIRRGIGSGPIDALDAVLSLDGLSPLALPKDCAWTGPDVAMLPERPLRDLGESRPEALLGRRGEGGAAHWIADAISKRALAEPVQMELFEGDLIAEMRRSLRVCCELQPACANLRDREGATPLHWAVYLLAVECVEDLLEAGGDPDAKSKAGIRAFDAQAFRNFQEGIPALPAAARRSAEMLAMLERWEIGRSTREGSGASDSGRWL